MKHSLLLTLMLSLLAVSCGTSLEYSGTKRFQDGIYYKSSDLEEEVKPLTQEEIKALAAQRNKIAAADTVKVFVISDDFWYRPYYSFGFYPRWHYPYWSWHYPYSYSFWDPWDVWYSPYYSWYAYNPWMYDPWYSPYYYHHMPHHGGYYGGGNALGVHHSTAADHLPSRTVAGARRGSVSSVAGSGTVVRRSASSAGENYRTSSMNRSSLTWSESSSSSYGNYHRGSATREGSSASTMSESQSYRGNSVDRSYSSGRSSFGGGGSSYSGGGHSSGGGSFSGGGSHGGGGGRR